MKIVSMSLALLLAQTLLAAPKPDKDMKKVLDELAAKGGKPIETLTAVEARKQPTPADAAMTVMKNEKKIDRSKLAEIRDITVDGAAGQIPARLYIPQISIRKPMPVVVYYSGGGFVIAGKDVYDATPKSLAYQSGAIFVSIDYRKAPEHKFPAAHDDAFAAYKWVIKNAGSFGGDPADVAVAGESAGGNLALNVAIKARDEKIQMPRHELLIYPVAGNDMNTDSYKENADAKPLNKAMMEWFVKNYLNTPAEANDTRINLLAANLEKLPPATIITAEIDPLRWEGLELSKKLKAAKVHVDYKNYVGVTHEFFGMASVVADAKNAQQFAVRQLKRAMR